jgi:hypothetical protein
VLLTHSPPLPLAFAVLHRGHQRERHRRPVGATRADQGSTGTNPLLRPPTRFSLSMLCSQFLKFQRVDYCSLPLGLGFSISRVHCHGLSEFMWLDVAWFCAKHHKPSPGGVIDDLGASVAGLLGWFLLVQQREEFRSVIFPVVLLSCTILKTETPWDSNACIMRIAGVVGQECT